MNPDYYIISSNGLSQLNYQDGTGIYIKLTSVFSDYICQVYKEQNGYNFLYRLEGDWCVGPKLASDQCIYTQESNNSNLPAPDIIWYFFEDMLWHADETLKVTSYYINTEE